MRDCFRRDISLGELLKEGVGDPTHSPFHDGKRLSFDEIEVEMLSSEKGDVSGQLKWGLHKSSLTQSCKGFKGSRVQGYNTRT